MTNEAIAKAEQAVSEAIEIASQDRDFPIVSILSAIREELAQAKLQTWQTKCENEHHIIIAK